MVKSILRRPAVEALTGLSRSSIYKFMNDGSFPKAIKLGPRAVGWPEDHVEAWINNRKEEAARDA
jgi:prophage regulatory protein